MKKFLSYFLIVCLLALGLFFLNKGEAYRYTPYQGNTGIDVQNYKIEILNINRDTRVIDFKTTVTANANRNFNSGERFGLDFVDTYTISEVLFNEQTISSGNYRITYTGSISLSGTNKRLEIFLPSSVNISGDIVVKVTYSGIPILDIDTSGLGFYSTGTELHAFNEPLGAHQRFPCSDVPGDKATLDFYVTTLTGKVVVGNGKLMYDNNSGDGTHTVYRKENYPISTYNVYIGVGPFTTIYSGTSPFLSGSQNIRGYAKSANTSLSNRVKELSTTTGMMKQMIDILGPYPFADEKFGTILRPINNYMEHNTIIGMSSVSNDTLMRHELAHQWIGNLITIAARPDLWITEAGGTYFPQVSRIGRSNREQASYGLSRSMDRSRALNNPAETSLFNTNLVYNRAAWTYHHLRSYLGNDLYFSGLDYYINKHAHGTVSTQQFKNTREEATNVNLSGFFNRFVYGTGEPLLRVTNFFDNINDGTYSGRAFFKLLRTDNKVWTPDVVFTKINYTDGSSGEFRLFQENQNNYLEINTNKTISGIVIDPGSGTVGRLTDYIGSLYNSGFSIQNDSDSDSLPDGREQIIFGNLNQTANGDYDSDGIINIDEYDLQIETTDTTGPEFEFSDNEGYECGEGYLTISGAQDTGVGLHTLPYSFDGTNRGTSNIINIETQRTPGEIIITGYVRDLSGNITSKTATYSFFDELVISDEFTGSDSVGSGTVDVNRKTSSNANEGICGNWDITADSIYQQGEKGTCTLDGDTLTYTPNSNQTGSDMCVISVIDNEGTQFADQLEVYRGGIDTTSTNLVDETGPNFDFSDNNGYECNTGYIIISGAQDTGVGLHTLPYSFDGINRGTSNIININEQSILGSIVMTGYVRDLSGNITSKTATYTFNNVGINANNFTGNANVGNSAKTGNWKVVSNASEGNCGSGSILYSGNTQGAKGTCSVSGEIITYTPSLNRTGNDSCIITVKDNENSTGTMTIYRGGIDTLAPDVVTCTNSQSFDNSISISCSASEGTIKYTSDGSNPTCDGNTWSNQVFENSTTIKIRSCDSYNNANSINTYIYTLNTNQGTTGSMSWTGATPQMGEIITDTGINISLNINDSDLESFNRNMNGDNFDMYNDNLVFMTNANNIGEIGENNTTLSDVSNYSNHGSITGATRTGGGREGNALFFRGGNTYDRVVITDNNSLDMTTGFTISAWIKPTVFVADGIIIAKPHTSFSSPYIDYGLGYSSSQRKAFQVGIGGGTTQRACDAATGTAMTGVYSHVVGVFNYNSLKIYVNGNLSNTCTFSGMSLNNVNTPLYLGYYPYGSNGVYNFKGRLDDIMLYNKSLNSQEIQLLYNMHFNKNNLENWTFSIDYNLLTPGIYHYTGFTQSVGGYQYWLNRNFTVYDNNDLVVLPSTGDNESIVNEFLNKGYIQNNGELSGSRGILLKNPNGVIKTNLNIRNNNNKVYIPNNITLRKKSNLSNFEGVINPPTDINVTNLNDVIKAIRVGSEIESLSLLGGTATISIATPGKAQGDEVSVYYSEDNGDTWNFHTNDNVELIGGQPYVEFTTNHFTDFAVTLPGGGGEFTGSFVINNDDASTSSNSVSLNISTTPEATHMRFSDDGSSRSARETYTATKSWTLPGTYGSKTVYAQFDANNDQVSDVETNDSINYTDGSLGGACVGGVGEACLSLEITAVTGECRYGINLDLGDHAQTYNAFTMTGSFTGNNNTYPLRRSCNDSAGKGPWNMQISSTSLIAGSYSIPNTAIELKTAALTKYRGSTSYAGSIGAFSARGTDLSTPRKVFEKTSAAGTAGEIGTDTVDLRVLVPINQEVGAYQATITIAYPQM